MRWIVVLAIVCGCSDDRGIVDRECAAEMLDSQGGVYPTEPEYGCFPGVGDASRVGVCEGGFAGRSSGVVFVWHGVFGACPACDAAFGPSDCRPLVCAHDSECPWFKTRVPESDEVMTRTFECRNGVCQDADPDAVVEGVIDYDDAELLCLADVGLQESYEGEPWCPGAEPGGPATCPLPLPDACLQP
jgi:hypothetical protein